MTTQNRIQTDIVVPGTGPNMVASLVHEAENLSIGAMAKRMGTWDSYLAYVISQVCSPPVLAPVMMVLTASSISTPNIWIWVGGYVCLAVVFPLLYLFWLLRRGLITDLDIQHREQRIRPLIFTVTCTGLSWIVLLLGSAPSPLVALAGASLLQMVVVYSITVWWKVSMHCATAGAAAAVMWTLTGTPLPLLIGVPVIAWSRVRLRRHTVAQTIVGALLGFVIFIGAFAFTKGQH
jgi:membrane-associated phospholipid phosphatase